MKSIQETLSYEQITENELRRDRIGYGWYVFKASATNGSSLETVKCSAFVIGKSYHYSRVFLDAGEIHKHIVERLSIFSGNPTFRVSSPKHSDINLLGVTSGGGRVTVNFTPELSASMKTESRPADERACIRHSRKCSARKRCS